jgi:hypothetical protein
VKAICDVCGKYSDNEKRCTNCGADIFADEEIPSQQSLGRWGWATFELPMNDSSSKENVLHYLREKWISLEEFTVLRLIDSQISRFESDAVSIKVLTREDFLSTIVKDALSKFEGVSVQFEPVDIATAEDANKLLTQG